MIAASAFAGLGRWAGRYLGNHHLLEPFASTVAGPEGLTKIL